MEILGRQQEFDQLQRQLAECVAGASRCVLVSGEAGIGKSALLGALAEDAKANGTTVLFGRGFDGADASPLWPVRSALRQYIEDAESSELEIQLGPGIVDLVGPIPQIAEKFPSVGADSRLGLTAQARFRFFESFRAFLARISKKNGLLLIIDDCQWSDSITGQLVEFLTTAGKVPRMLLVCAVRDPDAPFMERSRQEISFSSTHVSGLDDRSAIELVRRTYGDDLPSAEALKIQTRAAGNPLYLKELTSHLQRNDRLDVQTVPHSIVRLIERRMERLGPRATRLLRACSVIGSDFSVNEVRRSIPDTPREVVVDVLESCAREGLVAWQLPNHSCTFASHLVREAIDAGLTHEEKARIHALIFAAMAERDVSPPEYGQLTRHLLHAGSQIGREELVRWVPVLGQKALDIYDFDTASALFSHAAGRLADSGSGPALIAHMKFGEARALHGMDQPDAAKDALSDAFDRHVADGEIRSAAEVACYPIGPGQTGSPDLIARALDLLPIEPSVDGRVLAHAALHEAELRANDERSQSLFGKAMSIAEETDDHLLRMWILAWAGHVDLYQARPGECIVKHREALELNTRFDDPFVEIYTGFCVVSAGLGIGETSLALEAARRMSSESNRARYRAGQVAGARNEAAVYSFTGRWAEARTALKRGMELAPGNLGLNLFGLMVERITGNGGACEPYMRALEAIAGESPPGPVNMLTSVAATYANSTGFGSHVDSGVLREAGHRVMSSAQASVPGVFALGNVALALAAINESDRGLAREVAGPLTKMASCYPLIDLAQVCLLRLQMLIAFELGDDDRASVHFRDCRQFLEKAGFEPELAVVFYEYSVRSERAPESERFEFAFESQKIAERLGMAPLNVRASRLISGLDAISAGPSRFGGLTPREFQIAQLVAAGRSNREIAAELVISPHTARKHVSNILGKLDLANRTEIARYVIETTRPT